MNTAHSLQLPLHEADVRQLRVGDLVYLTGEIVISAGLPTYRRLHEELKEGIAPPLELRGGSLLHLGSQGRETDDEYELLYMNPTTSTRFNAHMPDLIRGLDLRITGGKGGLNAESAQAMKDVGCVYLSFVGGGCTLLSESIRRVTGVYWTEMVTHYRIVRVAVENLGPLTVGIDADGNSLYNSLVEKATEILPNIMSELPKRQHS
ncbi:MAG: fumarate hydratase [Hyphomicrobiales bacterium]|nr:MAG: fumarate hydratase [Hyphomicrobiales bacterium]